MHMSDALLSPAVGGTMWAAAAGLAAYSARRVDRPGETSRAPLMGVLGAFVFAAMMVNFSIPGTGSSGHLGGGLLLAILVGPHAAFVVMASVLLVQALFFADGGLLALGCNVVNLSFFTSFLAYPLIWKPLAGPRPRPARLLLASLAAAVAGLQLGSLAVVLETEASGISSLPFRTFALLMQPIHLAIGVVEGLVTASVVLVVWRARPELLPGAAEPRRRTLRPLLLAVGAVALVTAGVGSWFASPLPDGLEWSVARTAGAPPAPADPVHAWLADVQRATALLSGYGSGRARAEQGPDAAAPAWPAPSPGTSTSGVVGSLLVLGVAAAAGEGIRRARRRAAAPSAPGGSAGGANGARDDSK